MNKFQTLMIVLAVLFLSAGSCLAQVCNPAVATSAPDSRFTVNGNGTVLDNANGLIWKRCSEGQIWDGATCAGIVESFTWQQALQRARTAGFAGQSDWRLPNSKELSSLVEQRCVSPALNATVFPNIPVSYFWSSSPIAGSYYTAWSVNFYGGLVDGSEKSSFFYVRLVRGGQ